MTRAIHSANTVRLAKGEGRRRLSGAVERGCSWTRLKARKHINKGGEVLERGTADVIWSLHCCACWTGREMAGARTYSTVMYSTVDQAMPSCTGEVV